ncbi:hypothetical protein E2562_031993 [Oryza meyeriana var. granulata]|uniref:Uncharacterized protein n=1 Tax=Oryza meyeriana var. granulata TaxID=110450 RepID=A0A6G1F0D2_9ORYZ|nr:hypothetical protein E2562_031993 [Oryza meyeriana var. granulata]
MAPSSREATARARAPRSKRRPEPRCTGSSSRLDGVHRSHVAVCGFAQDDVARQNPPHLTRMRRRTLGRWCGLVEGTTVAARGPHPRSLIWLGGEDEDESSNGCSDKYRKMFNLNKVEIC